jgi:hypothetical protein
VRIWSNWRDRRQLIKMVLKKTQVLELAGTLYQYIYIGKWLSSEKGIVEG